MKRLWPILTMVLIMGLFVTSKAASLMLMDFPIGPERLPPMALTADLGITASPFVAPTITNNGGASGVTDNDATLNGEITSTGNENPTTIVYWGAVDQSTNATAWTNNHTLGIEPLGTVFYTATNNFTPSTMYFYRYYCYNSAGSDWADSTANFTTASGAYNPPAGLTLIDLGGITVSCNWTKEATANNTLIRISRSAYPSTITSGEWWYFDTGSSVNISGLNIDIMTLYVSAWSELSGNYSSTYAYASIGGVALSDIATAVQANADAINALAASLDFGDYLQMLLMLLPVIALSIWAIRSKYPVAFQVLFGVTLVVAFEWYNVFNNNVALTVSVAIMIYAFAMGATALYLMFKERVEGGYWK